MATRQNKENDSQTNHTSKASLWLGVLLVVISFASLSLVFSSFSSTAFASISSPSSVPSISLGQPYNLNASANSTGQQPKEPSEHTSSTIPSPAPLSLVALLLLVIAAAIRRRQNQT